MAGIASWTDIDYAQAAIDMWRGENEREFFPAQGIKQQARALERWVRRWTDTDIVVVGPHAVYLPTGWIPLP